MASKGLAAIGGILFFFGLLILILPNLLITGYSSGTTTDLGAAMVAIGVIALGISSQL